LDTDYSGIMALVQQDGIFLCEAVDYARGLRILRQEPFETLISFILSQRKSIPAIRNSVERLCAKYGRRLAEDGFAFPEPAALAEAGDEGLLSCGMGYRAKYVRQTAEMVARGQVCLEGLSHLPDPDLLMELTQLPGVGVKVASCVMLFAYHRLDAFPVDVWIDRVLRQHYPNGFPFEQYSGVSGVLQQQLFCYARWLAGKA
jgi:N-glycosylase/DNA lyase